MYVAALFLPTVAPFNPAFSTTTYPGYVAFGAWKVLIQGEPEELEWWVLSLAWLANPAIWAAVSLTAIGRRRTAGVAAGFGMILGLLPLPWGFSIVAGLPGYWAWVGTAGLLLAASLAPWHRVANGPAVPGGWAADFDDAATPPNPLAAPDRSG